jgi:hypothetical protein
VRFVLRIFFFYGSNLYFRYKQCLQKVLNKKRMRIVEERHDIMEFMMEVLMNKFDEMISRQGGSSRK